MIAFCRAAGLMLLLWLPACATVTTGTTQSIAVLTEPAGAMCQLTRDGTTIAVANPTPNTVTISKSSRELTVRCTRDGHQPAVATVSPEFQGATAGNLLLGGVVGIVIDAASGAASQYPPNINLVLAPVGGSRAAAAPPPAPPQLISAVLPGSPESSATASPRSAPSETVAVLRPMPNIEPGRPMAAQCPPLGWMLRTSAGSEVWFHGRAEDDPEVCVSSVTGQRQPSRRLYGLIDASGEGVEHHRQGLRALFPIRLGNTSRYNTTSTIHSWSNSWHVTAERRIEVAGRDVDVWVITRRERGLFRNIFEGEETYLVEKASGAVVGLDTQVLRGAATPTEHTLASNGPQQFMPASYRALFHGPRS
jgi:hypothetical protein